MTKNHKLLASILIFAATSAAKAEDISRGLPAFTLPSVQLEEVKTSIADSTRPENLPLPVAVPKRMFRADYDFLAAGRERNLFSPVSDLNKLKAIIESLPVYLNRANLDFESNRRVLEIVSSGVRNLDTMLLKYSSGTRTTRADFLLEAKPAMKSLETAFLVLKGNHNGGSYSDNCWSDCVEDCDPTDLGGIVCHMSCYYTCETTKP